MKIFVAGHNGMVGGALVRHLLAAGACEVVTRSRADLDLTDQVAVREFMGSERPDQVYLAAAKVGGIHANNTYPADFIQANLAIQSNLIDAAHRANVSRLLFLGSSCIYPKMCPQPMREEHLLTGPLEPTNEPYAIAKIAGIKTCESYNRQFGTDYRSVMPTNLYGTGDNFHPENSHVLPALMRRFHEAAEAGQDRLAVWGSGRPRREFLHVDDLAEACVHVMSLPKETIEEATQPMLSHINIGTGVDISIGELAQLMAKITGFKGEIDFDASKPDGTPQKLLDVSRLTSLGWSSNIKLEDGVQATYDWFRNAGEAVRS